MSQIADWNADYEKRTGLPAYPSGIWEQQITAYQIAKDNLELRLSEYEMDCLADVTNIPAQVY